MLCINQSSNICRNRPFCFYHLQQAFDKAKSAIKSVGNKAKSVVTSVGEKAKDAGKKVVDVGKKIASK